jgi:hypothetical protein
MEVILDSQILKDEQWKRIASELPGKVGDPSRPAPRPCGEASNFAGIVRRYW